MTYKFSEYNTFVKNGDNYICFNSMSGALFQISEILYLGYLNNQNSVSEFQENSTDLFNIMLKTRCIIPEDLNEMDILKFRNHRDVFINNNYTLILNPTMDCNFKCWYCYETKIAGMMSDDVKNRIIKHIKNLFEKNIISGLNLSWFGGEPLMCFDNLVYPVSNTLIEICKEHKLPFHNSITTNGYLIENNMIDKLKQIKLNSYQITLDGTKERHDKSRILKNGDPTYGKIMQNINLLCHEIEDANITLRINYKDETIKDIDRISNDILPENRSKVQINFHRIWQTFKEETSLNDKLQEHLQHFKKEGYAVNLGGNISNSGCKCYADRWHEAVINFNGDVYKCTARDFSDKNKDGVINEDGEIVWNAQKAIKRFSKATFENEKCLSCKFLPICMGPCSQKAIECVDIDEICDLKVTEMNLNDYIIDRYKILNKC